MINVRLAGHAWKACPLLPSQVGVHKVVRSQLPAGACSCALYYTSAHHLNRALGDPENKGGTQRGVNFDTLGAWNNRIELPVHMEQSIKFGKLIPKLSHKHISHASEMGRRKVNEDRHTVADLGGNIILFSIFDGHGGSLAADIVSEHVVDHVKFWLKKQDCLEAVLRHTFLDLNNLFSMHLHHNCPGQPPQHNPHYILQSPILRHKQVFLFQHLRNFFQTTSILTIIAIIL